jgi:alkylhydroperoxidase family enzyme
MKYRSVLFAATVAGLALIPNALAPQEAPKPGSFTRAGLPYLADGELQPRELVDAIRARRPGGKLLNLDRVLLESPNFARGWNTMFGIIRGEMTLEPKLRELVAMAIAALTSSEYEWVAHENEFLSVGGTKAQLSALRGASANGFDLAPFDEAERATLALTIEMTRNIAVRPDTMTRIRGLMSDQHVVELIGTIAGYNMVSRFLVATGVDLD